MADNTALNVGTGGDTIRDVDNSAYLVNPAVAKTQVVKPDIGGQTGESLWAEGNPAPVEIDDVTIQDTLKMILVELRVLNALMVEELGKKTLSVDQMRNDEEIYLQQNITV